MANDSSGPPTLDNPVGRGIEISGSIMLIILTAAVGMRLWGRYRYRVTGTTAKASYGELRFWVLISDITILLSYVSAVTLTAVQYHAVLWGQGLHSKDLSVTQRLEVLKMFFIYQVLYKFCSAIAKMATVFLLLAISTPQIRYFNIFCKGFATYMGLYCLVCSLVAVFQCGTNLEANWNKSLDQSRCFTLPPFWYAHAVINITATFVMAFLPWWLFASISYNRKYMISTIMSALALAETALGGVRLWSLFHAARDTTDLTYSTSIGQIVSQLEVDFATISSCIPTVLKLVEEAWALFRVHILRLPPKVTSTNDSRSKTTNSRDFRLSNLQSIERGPRPSGPYTGIGKDEDDGSIGSQDMILNRRESFLPHEDGNISYSK